MNNYFSGTVRKSICSDCGAIISMFDMHTNAVMECECGGYVSFSHSEDLTKPRSYHGNTYKHYKYHIQHDPVVYFMQDDEGLVKIGYTISLSRRHSQIKSEYGEIEILGWIWGGRQMEKQLHERFAEYRLGRSDWFTPNNEIFAYIESKTDGVLVT